MSRNARLIDRTSNSAAYPGIDGWCRIRRRLLLLGQLACYKECETAFAKQTRSVRITNRNKQVVDVVRCLGRRFQSHDACRLRVRTGGATKTAGRKREVEEKRSGNRGKNAPFSSAYALASSNSTFRFVDAKSYLLPASAMTMLALPARCSSRTQFFARAKDSADVISYTTIAAAAPR